jgi:predicted phage-related endonuclease
MHIADIDLNKTVMAIAVENVQNLSEEEYALVRRQGIGASDMAAAVGVSIYKTDADLIAEKRSTIITDEEREIGKKESVRKGRDLEPLILQKATQFLKQEPLKPQHMYKSKEAPYITTNFDGVILQDEFFIPVECKFVTPYGDKYYNKTHAIYREVQPDKRSTVLPPTIYETDNIIEKIKAKAACVGIPPYYYVQLQTQIYMLNSPYGYLAALHDKGWELCIYFARRDEDTIQACKRHASRVWNNIIA